MRCSYGGVDFATVSRRSCRPAAANSSARRSWSFARPTAERNRARREALRIDVEVAQHVRDQPLVSACVVDREAGGKPEATSRGAGCATQAAWKVKDPHACGDRPAEQAPTRSAISRAALLVNVMARMLAGRDPFVADQVRDAVGERAGLAGAGPGHDQDGPVRVQHGPALHGIEPSRRRKTASRTIVGPRHAHGPALKSRCTRYRCRDQRGSLACSFEGYPMERPPGGSRFVARERDRVMKRLGMALVADARRGHGSPPWPDRPPRHCVLPQLPDLGREQRHHHREQAGARLRRHHLRQRRRGRHGDVAGDGNSASIFPDSVDLTVNHTITVEGLAERLHHPVHHTFVLGGTGRTAAAAAGRRSRAPTSRSAWSRSAYC